MMILKKSDIMVFRFSPYKTYDFIEEHNAIIAQHGYTWLLKFGKEFSESVLNNIRSGKEKLILRAPKAAGGDYYRCIVEDAFNGKVNAGMKYPEYYNKILSDGYRNELSGTWLKVKSITQINKEVGYKLRLRSNDRVLEDVIKETRTVIMHTYLDRDITV